MTHNANNSNITTTNSSISGDWSISYNGNTWVDTSQWYVDTNEYTTETTLGNQKTCSQEGLDFDDVLLVPSINTASHIKSRKDVNLTMDGHRIPIVAANMNHTGNFYVGNILANHGLMTAINKDHSFEDWKNMSEHYWQDPMFLIPTIGLRDFDDEVKKLLQILSMYPTIDHVCFDVANGYLSEFRDKLKQLRKSVGKEIKIIAGNVVTPQGCQSLKENGADIIKVGIGPGSVCETRSVAGVGFPQMSALMNCHNASIAQSYINYADKIDRKFQIMADGGCVTSGDIAKAFGVSDYVMLGGMFAGHKETGSLIYGNSSHMALEMNGTRDPHRASEGRVLTLREDRGHLDDSIAEWLGGIRSACTYCNAPSLRELKNTSYYVKVRHQLNTSLLNR